jgi:hypothetical protein
MTTDLREYKDYIEYILGEGLPNLKVTRWEDDGSPWWTAQDTAEKVRKALQAVRFKYGSFIARADVVLKNVNWDSIEFGDYKNFPLCSERKQHKGEWGEDCMCSATLEKSKDCDCNDFLI